MPSADSEHSLPAESPLSDDTRSQDDLETSTVSAASSVEPAEEPNVAGDARLETSKPKKHLGLIQPAQLSEAPSAKWFVRPSSGGQYGPAASESMWQWLQENRIGRDSLVWREGWTDWLVATEVFADFFTAVENTPSSIARESNAHSPVNPTPTAELSNHLAKPISHESPVPLSERNRATRRQQRRRNYTVMIAILSVVMIALIVALAVVLSTQQD